jgi:hypothetical protein
MDRMSARAAAICVAFASTPVLAGCLFPDLDDLKVDGVESTDSDASACPNASDPTLEAYYRLDEGTGTVAKDCSAHGRDGVMVGNSGTWTTGKVGSALVVSSANGGTGCLDVPSFPNINGALTITAWVRVDKAPAPDLPGFIVAKSFNLNSEGWRISTEQASKDFALSLGGIGDAGLVQFGSTAPYAIGGWTYVTMVIDPDNRDAIYVNGELDMTKSIPSMTTTSNADLRLGCRGDTSPATYFDGAIDEVRIYSRALAASEIAALYNP